MTLSNEFTQKPKPEIRSYRQANEYLGKKDSRPLRYKTRVNRRGENIVITHHSTDIITYEPDGTVIIDTQGWHTVTTKDRLRSYLPDRYFIYQKDNIWYIEVSYWDGEFDCRVTEHNIVFKDGMRILPDGTIEGAGPPAKELKKLNKEILKYSRNYIKALFAGEVPKPSGGDCWFCMFVPETFTVSSFLDEENGIIPISESTNPADHLISHFEEKYYVPSLLVRAIEVFPVSPAAKWALGDLWGEVSAHPGDIRILNYARIAEHQLRSSLRRYLRRQLGLAS